MTNTMLFFAELSWELGLIGLAEFEERVNIALWLESKNSNINDPRLHDCDNEIKSIESEDYDLDVKSESSSYPASKERLNSEDDTINFVAFKTWYFTGSDPDSYPSVPHGHFQNPNNKWPKLNPYTGRVYSAREREDSSKRLDKKTMKRLWNDVEFRNYCRVHIIWYLQNHSHHKFLVRNPLKLPVW